MTAVLTVEPTTRVGRRHLPLIAHATLLGLVMLAGLVLFGQGALFHPDEGAMLLQEQTVDDTGGFAAPNPQPQLDPEMDALPIEIASRTDEGTWLPFAKHPTYVWAMVGSSQLFGDQGPLVLSCLGVVLAALATGLLAERVEKGLGIPTLWATGLAAPLFFDGYIVIAHAIGAALAAWLVLVLLRAADAPVALERWLLGLCAAFFAALLVLVRTEGVFLVGAVGASAALFLAPRTRALVLGIGVALAGGVAYRWIDPWLAVRASGTDLVTTTGEVGTTDIGRTVRGRPEALWTGLFDPTILRAGLGVLAGLGAATFWYAASRLRKFGAEALALGLLVVAVTLYALAATSGDVMPGLIVATPVLAGMLGLTGGDLRRPLVRTTVAAGLAFVAAVALTQYDTAGGGHVGGRYFVIGLPLVMPAAVLGWTRLTERAGATGKKWLPRLVAAAAITTVLQAGFAMRQQRDFVAALVDHVDDVRSEVGGGGGPAAVLSTNGWGSRYAWDVVDEGIWLATPNASLDRYSARLAARGEPVVFFTGDPVFDEPVLERRWEVDWRSGFVAVLTPR